MYLKFDKNKKYASVRDLKDKDAEISESLEGFDDAGYILNDNEVVVDIDDLNKATIEQIIDTFNINSQIVWTDRGAHLYFKKPRGFNRTRGVTPLGFKAEYKTSNNTRAVTIKRKGQKREVLNEGIREEMPQCLIPGKYKVMLGMTEGDGRNDLLHSHKMRINSFEDPEKVLRFINECIFETPLDEKEFLTLSRPEEVQTAGQDDEYVAAETLMREIDPVMYNEKVYFYHGNHYIHDDDVLRRIIANRFPGFKTRFTDEVIKQLEYRAPLTPLNPVFAIKLKNGYLYNGEFIEGDYTDFTPYYIDLVYDPDTEPVPIVDEYLDNLSGGNEEYKTFITEIFGHCLITDPRVKRAISKFFIFIGNGGEGKGTFLDIVGKILGEENCSRVSIDDLAGETYVSSIEFKLANLGDDQENTAITGKQMKKLKNIATCDAVSLRNLYENPRVGRPTATLIFTTNYELRSYDKDESYKRRVVWCPMFTRPKNKSYNFFDAITTPECLKYWIKLGVEGYMKIYRDGNGMEVPSVVLDYTKNYHEDNDPMPMFVDSLSDSQIEGKRSPQLYEEYKIWAKDNGERELSLKHMIKTIRERKGFEIKTRRIDKKPTRVFVKPKLKEK